MAKTVLMPQMGVSDESAILATWLVKEGDAVKEGQKLFSLETGKSSFDCLADADGTVLKLLKPEGEEVNVGVPVCVIGNPGESVDIPADAAAAAPKADAAPAAEAAAPKADAAPAPAAAAATGAPAKEGDFVKASPRARMLAGDAGFDVTKATPTGPDGRIIERDVKTLMANGPAEAAAPKAEAAASAPAAAAKDEYTDKPLSGIRKVIAKNMHQSLSEMAQLTLNRTFDATSIMNFRAKAKASEGFGLEKVTLNDFILYAVSRTLLDFPDVNAHFLGDKMRFFNTVNLGVAVDTPRGLMVPVLKGAEHMSLREISAAVKKFAAQCKDGTIAPADMAGGSFTVSNLGSAGIESFTPVVNPPQTAILGVDTMILRPREVNGEVKFYKAMGLSLTFDHRALDGSPAANFLKAVAERLENFELLLGM